MINDLGFNEVININFKEGLKQFIEHLEVYKNFQLEYIKQLKEDFNNYKVPYTKEDIIKANEILIKHIKDTYSLDALAVYIKEYYEIDFNYFNLHYIPF